MSTVMLTMPRLGETMEEGTVSEWLVPEGQAFDRGTPLVEFETDKTAVEYPALGPGRLVRTLVTQGDLVQVGDPIAEIDLMGEEDWVSGGQENQAAASDEPDDAVIDEATDAQKHAEPPMASSEQGGRVRATPLARRAARRAGISIEAVPGTGRRGRVELSDVERSISGEPVSALAAESWGSETGSPVLLVHGFAGDRQTFDQLGRALGRAQLSVRAIDLPSHGETEAEAQTFDDLVDALCGELNPSRPVALVGHSLGAAAAIAAANRKGGVSSLTLIAPAGLGLHIDAEFVSGMAQADSVGAVGHLLRRLSSRADAFSPTLVAQIHKVLSRGRLSRLADDICREGRQLVNERSALASLANQIPVRILVGTEDRILNWRDTLDVSPAIALHVFPAAGHMPHWDAPAEAAAIIKKGVAHDRG